MGKVSLNLQHKTAEEQDDEDKGTREANKAVASSAKNTTTVKPTTVKSTTLKSTTVNPMTAAKPTTAANTTAANTTTTTNITKKLKLNKKPKMSTIIEEASLQVQTEDGNGDVIQPPLTEKPTVTKLKRVLKISKQ